MNECLTTNDCQQLCTNTEGGYNCSCSQGFIFNSDNKTCDGMYMLKYCRFKVCIIITIQLFKSVLLIMAVLMVVLLLTTLNNVSVLQDILSTLHNALVCGARQYFYINGLFFCVFTADIDECSMFSPCEQECTNTDGSYQCSCTKGFILKSDNSTCQGKMTLA